MRMIISNRNTYLLYLKSHFWNPLSYLKEKQTWEEEKKQYENEILKLKNEKNSKDSVNDIVYNLKQSAYSLKRDIENLSSYVYLLFKEISIILPNLNNAVALLNKSIQSIPTFVSQFGKLCNIHQSVKRETQIFYLCDTYSSIPNTSCGLYIFPFSQDYHLINTLSKELLNSRSFFILSNESSSGISIWCQLCTSLSSSFVNGSIEVTTITGMNQFLPLFSGKVTSSRDIWNRITAAAAIGCHHCCSFKNSVDNERMNLTIWNMSVINEENKLDRGWNILKEILRLKQDKNLVVSYENSELAKSMQQLINGRLPSTLFLVDESREVLDMAECFQNIFREEKNVVLPLIPQSVQEMNALKNELFVMENDVDAYEDEIRRLNRTIEEKDYIISTLQKHR